MDVGLKKGHNPHPQKSANYLSLLTFWWAVDVFKLGYKRDLEVEDLYDALKEHRSDYLGDQLESLWKKELEIAKSRRRNPSLLRVLIQYFGRKALWLGFAMCCSEILFMIQPVFLGGLIRYFSPNSGMDHETALLYACGVVFCSLFNIYLRNPIWLGGFHTGMKLRVGCCSLIYRKALRLSKTALGETTVGQTVNLLSNDVSRFDKTFLFISFLVIGPVETIIMLYVMWLQIGIAAVFGVAAILLVIPMQAGFGKMISTLRMRTAKRTDERIRFMNEIIVGIQVIKMYAWEKPFAHLVSLARRHEIKAVRATCYVRGLLFSFSRYLTKIAVFVSIVSYVLLNEKVTAEQMFVITAYFNIMKQTMTENFPFGIIDLAETSVSVKRIQTFLMSEEVGRATECTNLTNDHKKYNIDTHRKTDNELVSNETNHEERLNAGGDRKNSIISLSDVTAKWNKELADNTLTSVNLNVASGELVAVIGPVGSGKTSLLHSILKELPINSGLISVRGSISYASQEPWLFTGSVQQNILFGQPMDRQRYSKVVKVCALERDFNLLSHGDKTIVGERGVTLSGGQRARINLARAVYKEADIYLLDDPLSAVDTHVGRHLFDDCISEFLQHKTRILVTHQLQYLHTTDNIIILNNGVVDAVGTFTSLQSSGLDFAKQLESDAVENDRTDEGSVRRDSQRSLNIKKRLSETSQMSCSSESEPKAVAEMRTRGSVASKIYRAYFSAGGNFCLNLAVFGVSVLAQLSLSGGDYWMSYWSYVEERRATINGSLYNVKDPAVNSSQEYQYSNVTNASIASVDFGWLPSSETCIYVYTGIVVSIVAFVVASIIIFFSMCMKASVNLHNAMFSSITRATMWFFNNNPSGQILNRFSKDMGQIDEILPGSLIDCIQVALSLLGVAIVVVIVNVWLLIPTAVVICVFYFLRTYYVTMSRSVKRLEGITRSPVFSHLNASLQGLTTIRALGAERMLEKEFDSHQDLHSSTWYTYITTTRAFAVWLDSSCFVYITLVTFSFLIVGGEQYGGDVGLAITQAMGLTGFIQWGIRQSAELENQMTSVERVLEYTKIEPEASLESSPENKPQDDWPTRGEVVFEEVFLAYSKDEPSVLKKVNFSIKPSEKVGIVGRTGAGKSSLISALFRLVDVCDGRIRIDGVDTLLIGLHDLRSKISIIPQEPALFSGTLRENLDPFDQYSDAALWSALAEVELKQAVDELPAGLSHKVSEGGSNFSVGQRQLLCLARAIIRNNKILVLDEATANVDPQTDELIQATIRRKFAECTVLTIAHRLHTVMDSDRIIVMDAGQVVEFDHPHILLKNKNGVLYQMVQQTGASMASSLHRMAQNTYEKHRK